MKSARSGESRCGLCVVGKSRERVSRVRFAHEKTRAKIGTDGLLTSVPVFRVSLLSLSPSLSLSKDVS